MTLQYDRKVVISVGTSRTALKWVRQEMMVSELWERLKTPQRGSETLTEYFAMPRAQQAELKDRGGFLGGSLRGLQRKRTEVTSRSLITLDFDSLTCGASEFHSRVDALSYCAGVYSTRKSTPQKPRYRLIVPLDRDVSVDEYGAVARRVAESVGIDMVDPTCFEVHQMMFWPTVCRDAEYEFWYQDRPLLSADQVLGSYTDWKNAAEWPMSAAEKNLPAHRGVKQADPRQKPGIVGAFTRCYSITAAMEKFIPGRYVPVADSDTRFTYTGGSTTGGALVYDDDLYLFSHHSTDPCSEREVNAFDMVRLHLFGGRDDRAKPGTPDSQLPSYKAMKELCMKDEPTVQEWKAAQRKEVEDDFAGVAVSKTDASVPDSGEDWLKEIRTNAGGYEKTIANCRRILENDPAVKDGFALNEFSGRVEVLGSLPWAKDFTRRRAWSDTDSAGLYELFESGFGITNRANVDSAFILHAEKRKFHEVRAYLLSLKWDGQQRLDTLFRDFLGADDDDYTRAVCRKGFVAAVKRVMEPGCKYDQMPILYGPQGLGKSTLLRMMGKEWFSDSLRTFEGKESIEALQGKWLLEIGELDVFRKTDSDHIKNFLSIQSDQYRPAYARHAQDFPRQCVIFGTCNRPEFLRDQTGNRRFWPVDVGRNDHRSVFTDLTPEYVDQVWAEAALYWRMGEELFLSGEVAKAAVVHQEAHREQSPLEGQIRDFVEKPVPADWLSWSIDRRQIFWGGGWKGDATLRSRDRICCQEIWCEMMDNRISNLDRQQAREINQVLAQMPGWERSKQVLRFGPYGPQRGYVRCNKV